MAATIQTIQKPTRARALDTSTSYQYIGHNLYAHANACKLAADGITADETDATTGFTNATTSTFATSSTAHTGSKSITFSPSGNGGRIYTDLGSYMTVGKTYEFSFYARHGGSGGDAAYLRLSGDTGIGSGGTLIDTLENTVTTFTKYSHIFTYDLSQRYFGIKETGPDHDGVYYVDSISLREVESFGNNNHGQIYSGRALEFDGVSDYLNAGVTAATLGITNDVTVACWMNSADLAAGGNAFIWNFYEDTSDGFGIKFSSSTFKVINDIDDADTNLYQTTLELNTWYRVIVVLDNLEVKLYLNGVLSGSGTSVPDGLDSYTSNIYIGNRKGPAGSSPFTGMLSDFQVWDTVWTADDALYDYNNPEQLALNRGGTSLTNSNLKLWYPINDGHRGQQSYILDASNTGLGDEITSNGDFSIGATGDTTISGWNKKNTDGSDPTTYELSNEQTYNGHHTLKIVGQATGDGARFTASYTAGVTYKLDVWVYVVSGTFKANPPDTPFSSGSANVINSSTTGEWENIVSYVVCDSTVTNSTDGFFFQCVGGAATFYIGEASIKPVNDKNHATTVFYGDELISDEKNRVFGSSPDWLGGTVNGSNTDNDFATYDEAANSGATEGDYFTDNYLKVISNDDPSNVQYCRLDGAEFETNMVVGRKYRLSYSVEITTATKGTLSVGFAQADATATIDTTEDNVYDSTESAKTDTQHFVYKGTTTHAQLVIKAATSSVFTAYFDNFSIQEVGTATGWTDADQQLDIPQTALQSYNQLAWFPGEDPGTDYDIEITDHESLDDVWDSGGTLSAWIYPINTGASDYGRIFDKGTWLIYTKSESGGYCNIEYTFKTDGNDATGQSTNRVVKMGAWNHVVVTNDASSPATQPKIYINGEEVAVTENSPEGSGTRTSDNGNNLFIGNRSDGARTFGGTITEVSFWDTVLSQSSINSLYNDGKALNCLEHPTYIANASALKGYWRNNGLSTWTDLSSNSNNGTVNNLTETMLITAGVDGSRDSQGFLMNRQRTTNSLNLRTSETIGSISACQDSVKVEDSESFDHDNGSNSKFSISLWFKPSKLGSLPQKQTLLSKYDTNGDQREWWLYLDTSGTTPIKLIVSASGTSGDHANSLGTITTTDWHHIVVTYDGSNFSGSNEVTSYLDGGSDNATNATNVARVFAGTAPVRIGDITNSAASGISNDANDSYGLEFDGEIDDVCYYNRKILSATEAKRMYNAGKRSHR